MEKTTTTHHLKRSNSPSFTLPKKKKILSVNAQLGKCIKMKDFHGVWDLYQQQEIIVHQPTHAILPSMSPTSSILHAMLKICIDKCESNSSSCPHLSQVLSLVTAPFCERSETTYSSVLHLCAIVHAFEDGFKVLELLQTEKNSIFPKARTFSPFLQALCEAGRREEIIMWRVAMESFDIALSQEDFISVLTFFSSFHPLDFLECLEDFIKAFTVPNKAAWRVIQSFFTSQTDYTVDLCSVDDQGTCSLVNTMTIPVQKLTNVTRTQLLSQIDGLVCTNASRTDEWIVFKNWLKKQPSDGCLPQVFLDGANIGHFATRGVFSLIQIDTIVQSYVRKGQQPLVILHHNRVLHLSEAEADIVTEWRANNQLYTCPKGHNDDWFWLYAAMCTPQSLFVTNDLMRDHHFLMVYDTPGTQGEFRRWKSQHQVLLSNDKDGRIAPIPPVSVTRPSFKSETTWYVSNAADATWLVIRKKKDK